MKHSRTVLAVLASMFGVFGVCTVAYLPHDATKSELLITVPPKPIMITVFGDMMLDRSVRTRIDRDGVDSLFVYIKDWIALSDITFVNAEGVFTNYDSIAQKDTSVLRFTFSTTTLSTLENLGFDFLGQANNHTADFGKTALEFSRAQIRESGMIPIGDYFNENPGPEYQKVGDITIAFVAYNQFGSSADRVLFAIAEGQKNSDFVIVIPHWGEEYLSLPTVGQQQLGRKFIDAGADVVIGMHPHVIQSIEEYDNKLIFYSIGNFIFDQWFSSAVSEGIAVQISLAVDTVKYTLLPYTISQSIPKPMDEENTQRIMKKIQTYSQQIGFTAASSSMTFTRE